MAGRGNSGCGLAILFIPICVVGLIAMGGGIMVLIASVAYGLFFLASKIIQACKNGKIKKKNIAVTLSVIAAIAALWFGIPALSSHIENARIIKAVELIEQNNLEAVENILSGMSGNETANNLKRYVKAVQIYNPNDETTVDDAYNYMSKIHGYDGALSADVNKLRIEITSKYNDIKRREEKAKIDGIKESYKNKIPFVGLQEKYIGYTALGTPHYVKKCLDFDALSLKRRYKNYYWKSTSGETVIDAQLGYRENVDDFVVYHVWVNHRYEKYLSKYDG